MMGHRNGWAKVGILSILLFYVFLPGCGMATPQEKTKAEPAQKENVSTASNATASTYPKDALHKAAHSGNIEEVREILKTKPDPDARDSFGGTALHAAMFQKNMQIVELLIDYGLDINAIGPTNGYTPLHDAVWADNKEAVKLLLAKGARPDIKAKDGLTPIEKAQQEGKNELVECFKK